MVQEGIVLRHRLLKDGLEVDTAEISTVETLVPSTTFRGVRSFLRHAGFYRRLIDGSKSHPFLRPFFMNIQSLKMQFSAKSWSLHPDLCFEGMYRKEAKNAMLRHRLENVTTSHSESQSS